MNFVFEICLWQLILFIDLNFGVLSCGVDLLVIVDESSIIQSEMSDSVLFYTFGIVVQKEMTLFNMLILVWNLQNF